jgi:hypothetical protein
MPVAAHARPPGPAADQRRDGPILLFYEEYETDKFVRGDRALKRLLRPLYGRLHSRQKVTGFAMSFELMRASLAARGHEVRVNDYDFARANPSHPVGIVGFPHILDGWDLPNPALLGPSLHDHPALAPDLMRDPRFHRLLVLADWTRDMFAGVYGEDAVVSWHAGIDLARWPDASGAPKDIDVLIYDKIRWDRYVMVPHLLERVRRDLAARGLATAELRYKMHDHASYLALLRRSKAMVFLCEHETQGIAYQEALACGVPVLAWDFGIWADPLWKLFSRTPIPASSVPFFSPDCGATFATPDAFAPALDRFLAERERYRPRRFVEEVLSMRRSAEIYANAYYELASACVRL